MAALHLNPAGEEAATRRSRRGSRERKHADDIDYGPLENWVGFHLRLAQNASFQAFVREARGVDLSPGRFATLLLIGRNPGISQTSLSRANARDKSSLTPVLEDLERRKLIRRTRTRRDRRSYELTLTPAGERLLQQLIACAERHDENLDRIIGPRNKARFLQTLKKIIGELTAPGDSNGAAR
jgi:DNA-binding MarR family transcriptional regulator